MTVFFALLFSLVVPGAGQIFTGHYGEGIALGLLFALGKSVLLPQPEGPTSTRKSLSDT